MLTNACGFFQNFDFRSFELSRIAQSTTLRSPDVTVKVWAQKRGTWALHLQEQVDLRMLNFLGSSLGTPFPPNCLVFHLTDGVYTLGLPPKTFPPRKGNPQPTSSYNALMRLSTLDRSIQDALATQQSLKRQINDIIANSQDEPVELQEAEDRLKLTNRYVAAEQRAMASAAEQVEQLKASIADRREKMAQGRSLMEKTEQDMNSALVKLSEDKGRSIKVKDDIRGQRRRICEDLNNIFRIEPVPDGKPLQFQIRNVPLSNAEDYGGITSGADEDALSAALGHVALLTHHLQFYLGVALPYPITCCGSRSYITDDISVLKDPVRDFPLYLPRGGSSAQFRFDYGWFILNKDIEALCAAQGLKVMDIRHTLPNLKYLLYVCSAGTDELPERKKGGVRGLRAGIMRSRGVSLADDTGSLASSRRGSVDSDAVPGGGRLGSDDLKRKIKEAGNKAGKDGTAGRVPEVEDIGLPFEEDFGKLTLRTKGMREHVGR